MDKWTDIEISFLAKIYKDYCYGKLKNNKITDFQKIYIIIKNEFISKWIKSRNKTQSYLKEFAYCDPSFDRKTWTKKKPTKRVVDAWNSLYDD